MSLAGKLRIEDVRLSPGQEWADESAVWRFVRVDQGEAYWLEPAGPRFFSPGETAVVAPADKTVVRASQLQPAVMQVFGFSPDLVQGFFTVNDRLRLEEHTAGKPVVFLPSTHFVARQFAALSAPAEPRQELVQRAELLCLVAAFFSEETSHRPAAPNSDLPGPRRFRQIIGQMPEKEFIRHTAAGMASLCGCSPRHFFRLFRQHFGTSVRERQTEVRMMEARRLLADGETQIQQVALECGYHSLNLFNQHFKLRFGVTPSSFRETAGKGNGGSM